MKELVQFVRAEFRQKANAKTARQMAAYMKTEMPFYGIPKPGRVPVYRELKKRFPLSSRTDYQKAVLALWNEPHRETKYTALFVARAWRAFIVPESMRLYKRLIVEGAWWDLVDEVAAQLSGVVWMNHRETINPTMDQWIDHKNLWLRRSALIGQIKHKKETDEKRLFDYCLRRADEKDFFIRKAIGWALREYARVAPARVKTFALQNKNELSPLSFREATKHLNL